MPHTSFGSLANRVSYVMNLAGPSMPVDTMCSASLTAIHEACEHLLRDECELAFAGGVNLYLHPSNYRMMCAYRMLSVEGRCHTFGAGGDGFVPGEGVGAVLLKPLARAVADRDPIHGVIRATGINHGGKTNGYTIPNPVAQRELIAATLAKAGVDARTVSYIEAHGTGTVLGDPIEITGLTQAFARHTADTQFCAIGSVKSNIGHAEAAAGIAGLTKVLLQLKHRQLVPSLHAETLNPNIDFTTTPFVVQRTLTDWQRPQLTLAGVTREYPRLAGLSSFGAGGANAHALIEEYIAPDEPPFALAGPAVIVLSARSDERLKVYARQLAGAIARRALTDADLPQLAYTLQIGREPLEHRLAFTATAMQAVSERLQRFADGDDNIDGLHRGEVKRNKEALSVFTEDDELHEAVVKWLDRGKYSKVLGLWVKGLEVDWTRLYPHGTPRVIALPTYPFARDTHWLPLGEPERPQRGDTTYARGTLHPLLHENASDFTGTRFVSRFTGTEFFLDDHKIGVARVLPAVAYLEMVRAATERAANLPALREAEADGQSLSVVIRDVAWVRPLVVNAATNVEVCLTLDDAQEIGFEVYADASGERLLHSRGRALVVRDAAVDRLDVATLSADCDRRVEGSDCYGMFAAAGLNYGPAYRALDWVAHGTHDGEAFVLARLARSADGDAAFELHPGLMDGALQATTGFDLATGAAATGGARLPFALEEIRIRSRTPDSGFVLVRRTGDARANTASKFDLDICDESGLVCVTLRGFTARQLDASASTVAQNSGATGDEFRTVLLLPRWDAVHSPFDVPATNSPEHVLIVGGTAEQHDVLHERYPDAAVLAATGEDTVDLLARRLAAIGTVGHLVWILPTPSLDWRSDELIQAQHDGLRLGFRLVKAFLQLGYGSQPLRWTVVTRQTQAVVDGDRCRARACGRARTRRLAGQGISPVAGAARRPAVHRRAGAARTAAVAGARRR